MGSIAKSIVVFIFTLVVMGLLIFLWSWDGWSGSTDTTDEGLRALRWTTEQWLTWAAVSTAIAFITGLITWVWEEWD
jgi:hypothetical protein